MISVQSAAVNLARSMRQQHIPATCDRAAVFAALLVTEAPTLVFKAARTVSLFALLVANPPAFASATSELRRCGEERKRGREEERKRGVN